MRKKTKEWEFETDCDMGQVKIHTKDVSLFFDNGMGDVPTRVEIIGRLPKSDQEREDEGEFLGHFTVKTKGSVSLSYYDCDDSEIFTFPVGRWFVYRKRKAHLVIRLNDLDTHA